MNVSSFLHKSALNFPHHIAIHDEYGDLSYMELSTAVKDCAILLKQFGIGKQNSVGVMGRNSRGFIIMSFAVMETDAVVMPIASHITNEEFIEILNSAKLQYIIHDQTKIPSFDNSKIIKVKGAGEIWNLRKNTKVPDEYIFAAHVPKAALVRFTSGTTGISKGVILSHKSIAERTEAANNILKLNETDKIMWVLSMAYHFVVSIILYIRYGCALIINHDFLASTLLKEIQFYGATIQYY